MYIRRKPTDVSVASILPRFAALSVDADHPHHRQQKLQQQHMQLQRLQIAATAIAIPAMPKPASPPATPAAALPAAAPPVAPAELPAEADELLELDDCAHAACALNNIIAQIIDINFFILLTPGSIKLKLVIIFLIIFLVCQ